MENLEVNMTTYREERLQREYSKHLRFLWVSVAFKGGYWVLWWVVSVEILKADIWVPRVEYESEEV